MWELDHKEGWALKTWCFQTVVLEKTLESPLDSKEIKPVSPKGNQPWIFTGRTDAEPEAPILWPPDANSWFIGKDPHARKDWGQEKGATENEMVGLQHQLSGHETEQTLGESEGQRSLARCSPWGHKEWDTTERLNNSNKVHWLYNWPWVGSPTVEIIKLTSHPVCECLIWQFPNPTSGFPWTIVSQGQE